MGRKSQWYQEFDRIMAKVMKPTFYGMNLPDVPDQFDPNFWREWTSLPWEWDYRQLHAPPITRQDQVGLMQKAGEFLGGKAFNVYVTLYILASEREKDGRWVRLDYTGLAKRAQVSRRIAVKHVKRLRHCNLIRLLEPGVHGQSNVYYVPPILPTLLWMAEMRWYRLSREDRKALRSREILRKQHR